jgi:MYXO-CTERM domain-containing protein
VLAGDAAACVCVEATVEQRLDDADAAVVGRIVSERVGDLNGAPQRFLTVAVEQRVKGDVERTVEVRSPFGGDCDIAVPRDTSTGFLLTSVGGGWFATACSVVEPGQLVAAGGEPRGGPIKVVIGAVVLALVLGYALLRLRRGSRPQLPGAPGS